MKLDEELIYGPMDVRDGAPVVSYLRPGTPVQIFAAAVIASLPIVLLFAFLQRYYVQGVVTSGLK